MGARHDALLGLMKEKNIDQKRMSEIAGVSLPTINHKLKGDTDFKTSEITKICRFFGIDSEQIGHYFFSL